MRNSTISLILATGICILSIASTSNAQGLFLGKGQSGVYFAGGGYGGEDISGFGLSIGGTFRGIVDFGLATTKATIEHHSYYYYGSGSYDQWNSGFLLREYPLRITAMRGGNITLYLSQGVSWVSTEMIPSSGSRRVYNLGAGVSCGIPMRHEMRILVIYEYDRLLYPSGRESDNAFEGDVVLSLPFDGNRFVIGPSIGIGEDVTTFGVNAGVNIGL